MRPIEKAEALYGIHHQPRSFWEDWALHRATGHVIDTDEYFLMGRAVMKSAPEETIRSPHVSFHNSICDAWFIWIFVGDITSMLHLAPYPLPYVGWSRRNGPIRWYPSEGFKERVGRQDDYKRKNTTIRGMGREEIRQGLGCCEIL